MPNAVLQAVAVGLNLSLEQALQFEGRTIRELYVEGVCGGALLPLGRAGQPRQEIHVPLAHQSALAGVLPAAALAREAAGNHAESTRVSRIDVLKPMKDDLTQAARRAGDHRCICEDRDFLTAYHSKYGDT